MRASLRRLLDHPIDYAGLFPPANFDMATAVAEYRDVLASADSWIIDRFICPAQRLEEFSQTISRREPGSYHLTVLGTVDGTAVSVKQDAEAIGKATANGVIQVDAYEVKLPGGSGLAPAVASVAKLGRLIGDEEVDVYLEVGWGDDMVDAMHESVSVFEAAGFKARTGGVSSDAFPDTASVASFISECAALECTFKFTAGLHEPVRYYDEDMGVYRHGFLNVMLAGALAVTQDLNRKEIEKVLEIDDPMQFNFGVDDIKVGTHWIEAKDIEQFWASFGGFGSCSIQEPLDGLRRLRLLDGVEA